MKDKHSWSIKAASVLMSLTLISSCFLGGTFSKYIVTNSASDKARVAKFGVTVTTQDFTNLFASEYTTTDKFYEEKPNLESTEGFEKPSVRSEEAGGQDDVIAPGTYYEPETKNPNYSITGKPEVAVRVKTGAEINIEHMDDHMPIIFRVEKTSKSESGDKATTSTATTIKYFYLSTAYDSSSTVKLNDKKSIKLSADGKKPDLAEKLISEEQNSSTTVPYEGVACTGIKDFKDKLVSEISSVNDYMPNTDLSDIKGDGCYISWYWPFEYSATVDANNTKNGYEYKEVETGAQIYENDTGLYKGDTEETATKNKAGVTGKYDTADISSKDTGLGDAAAKAEAFAGSPNISISFAVSIEQID